MSFNMILQSLASLIPIGVDLFTRIFSPPPPPPPVHQIHTLAPSPNVPSHSRQDRMQPNRKSLKDSDDDDNVSSSNPAPIIALTLGVVLGLAIIAFILFQRGIKRRENRMNTRRTERRRTTPDSPSPPQTYLDDRPPPWPTMISSTKTSMT